MKISIVIMAHEQMCRIEYQTQSLEEQLRAAINELPLEDGIIILKNIYHQKVYASFIRKRERYQQLIHRQIRLTRKYNRPLPKIMNSSLLLN